MRDEIEIFENQGIILEVDVKDSTVWQKTVRSFFEHTANIRTIYKSFYNKTC